MQTKRDLAPETAHSPNYRLQMESVGANRIVELDLARGLALVAMVIFHFVYDLAFLGVLDYDTMQSTFWQGFAILTAGSFIFISGISLHLAHGDLIRWRFFLRRLAILAMAAGLVSAATYFAMPQSFIYFGILHSIALSSIVGLAFLRTPVKLGILVSGVVLALPGLWKHDFFDAAWLLWTGLSQNRPASVDYEPFFPWFAPFLLGIVAARAIFPKRSHIPPKSTRRLLFPGVSALIWLGRYSLIVYLLHQPILLAALWATLKIGGFL